MKLLWHHLIKKLQLIECCSKILWVHRDARLDIYITISTFTSIRPSGVVVGGGGGGGVPLSIFKFLQSYDKMSLIKVA